MNAHPKKTFGFCALCLIVAEHLRKGVKAYIQL
jgi:hypothetical protein